MERINRWYSQIENNLDEETKNQFKLARKTGLAEGECVPLIVFYVEYDLPMNRKIDGNDYIREFFPE